MRRKYKSLRLTTSLLLAPLQPSISLQNLNVMYNCSTLSCWFSVRVTPLPWPEDQIIFIFTVFIFWCRSRRLYLDPKPFPTEYLQSVVKFINTKKFNSSRCRLQVSAELYVLSVKIYKCDFDSLGVIYHSIPNTSC